MWQDLCPKGNDVDSRLQSVDSKLNELSEDARRASWQRDTIQLARDVAGLGKLYGLECRSERALKTHRILHCKAQNSIGGSLVQNYMSEWSQFYSGKQGEVEVKLDKVGVLFPLSLYSSSSCVVS